MYIRISSNKQTLEHQCFEIENFVKREGIKIDKWTEEKIYSRKVKSIFILNIDFCLIAWLKNNISKK